MTESQKLAKSKFITGLRNIISRECASLGYELIAIGREDLAKKAAAIDVTVNEVCEQIHEIHTS